MPLSMSAARASGLLYLVLGVLGAFSIAYLPMVIHLPGDPQSTFENAVQSVEVFRVSIASGLLHKVLLLCLVILFFHLFGRERPLIGGAMVAFVATSVPMYFVVMRDLYTSLPLLTEGAHNLDISAPAFFLNVETYLASMELVSVFWGLWLLPLGYLIIKTRRVPRLIGGLLILGGVGYLLNFFAPLIMPSVYANTMFSLLMATSSAVAEIGLALWLLVFGVTPSAVPAQIAVSRGSNE